MPPARMLLGTALALTLAGTAGAATAPGPATVLTDGAAVRCKPGTEPAVYVTQKLPRGSVVQVVERMPNGWLKIEPPLPGSYSWVNTRFLRQADGVPGVWIVSATDGQVPALVGSWMRTERPNVVGTTLARGAQVIAVGGTLRREDGDWLPILPPPGEYRYLLAKDVSGLSGNSSPPPTVATHSGSLAAPATSGAAGLPALPAKSSRSQSLDVHVGGPPPAADPLLQRAEQLERSGDQLGAAGIYDFLGKNYWNSNHEAAIQYQSHAAWLRGRTTPAAPAPVTEADAIYLQARQAEDAHNWPEAIRHYTRLGDLFRGGDYTLSMRYYYRANWLKQRYPAPAGGAAPVATGAAPTPSTAVQARAIDVRHVGPGRLAVSPTTIDGRPTYLLESAQLDVIAYLTPQPGVDLERYVGHNIEVLGQIVPRSDVRGQYLTVARVLPLSPP